jgi:indole-3-glycerol phosphate synthase
VHDFLKQIIFQRRQDIAKAKKVLPQAELRASATKRTPLSFTAALKSNQESKRLKIIAEIKRASPSEGKIRADLDPGQLAHAYQDAGAIGISVLTEPHYFVGSDQDLHDVRQAVNLPILRKDFTIDPWQVYQSAVLGADVILLIVAALDSSLLKELYAVADELRLETIVEVHSAPEIETALALPKAIIGVNNRDLTTLKTDLSTAVKLAPLIPRERIAIAESGIKSRRKMEQLTAVGYCGFLVGTSLLKARSPAEALKKLIGPV